MSEITIKPRIKLIGRANWQCADEQMVRCGKSGKQAYDRWLNASLRDAMSQGRAFTDPKTAKLAKLRKSTSSASRKGKAPPVRIFQQDPDDDNGCGLRESKSLPGATVDRSYGVCRCWIYKDAQITRHDREAMLDALARDVLRKPSTERSIWLQEWMLRHGKFAAAVLNRHVEKIQLRAA